jgi:hypothetical protein
MFESADKPSALILVAVSAASVAAAWLFFGSDLSEVDDNYQPVDNPVPVTHLRAVLAVLLVFGVVVVCSWLTPRAWIWIAGVATLSVEAWVVLLGFSARTIGANLMLLWAVWILPLLIAGTFGPAYVASLMKRRPSRATP